MPKIYQGNIFLNREEWNHFQESLNNPNPKTLEKREAFFAECNRIKPIVELPDKTIIVEVPDDMINFKALEEIKKILQK